MLHRLRRCSRAITRVWRVAQVELRGQYSDQRLLSFRDYCRRASKARCLLVFAVTPLPSLLATLLIKCIPLRPPSEGIEHSHMLWLRTVGVMVVIEFSNLHQCRCLVPSLPTSSTSVLVATIVVAVGCTAGMYGVSVSVGFPLPFTFLAGAPVTATLMLVSMLALWGRFLAENRAECWAFVNYFVIPVQVGLACAYPGYAYVFNQLSAGRQVAALALFPVIKVLTKNVLIKICRNDDDVKPLVVVLNAEIYHVLFFSWCMNGTTSKAAIAALALADVLETALAVHDVNQAMAQLTSTDASCRAHVPLLGATTALVASNRTRPSRQHIGNPGVGPSVVVAPARPATRTVKRWRRLKWPRVEPLESISLVRPTTDWVSPQPNAASAVERPASHGTARERDSCVGNDRHSREFLRHALRLVYLTEFVLLIEYMEVVTPCLYSKWNSVFSRHEARPRLTPKLPQICTCRRRLSCPTARSSPTCATYRPATCPAAWRCCSATHCSSCRLGWRSGPS